MNKYQACIHYHEANGFLPAKHAEEFEERKEALILHVQHQVLCHLTKDMAEELIVDMSLETLKHMVTADYEDSDECEEVIQILTNKSQRDAVNRWYRYN